MLYYTWFSTDLYKSNTTGDTCGAGTAYPIGGS